MAKRCNTGKTSITNHRGNQIYESNFKLLSCKMTKEDPTLDPSLCNSACLETPLAPEYQNRRNAITVALECLAKDVRPYV